jgi:hypothetical protein
LRNFSPRSRQESARRCPPSFGHYGHYRGAAIAEEHRASGEWPWQNKRFRARKDLLQSGILCRSSTDFGVELAYADEEVDATAADANVAQLLGVHKRAPVLRIRQAIYSTQGKATVYVAGYVRAPHPADPARPAARSGFLQGM